MHSSEESSSVTYTIVALLLLGVFIFVVATTVELLFPTPQRSPFSTQTQNKETIPLNESPLPPEKEANLKAIYDSAPERRAAVDRAVSGSSNPVRVDNDIESPKLEAILKGAGWSNPTVTEGVKEAVEDGYIFRLEVIDDIAQDWYVQMKTDKSITTGTVQSKSKHSPW